VADSDSYYNSYCYCGIYDYCILESRYFMKQDNPIPNAPVYADLRNRGLTCIGIAGTEKGLEKARSQGLRIFEPRLNYSTKEYNEICKRRQKYNK
jgi:hypothetical protein